MSITTNVKHRVRTTGSEHQGQNSISDPDQNLGFTCIFSPGMQELSIFMHEIVTSSYQTGCKAYNAKYHNDGQFSDSLAYNQDQAV